MSVECPWSISLSLDRLCREFKYVVLVVATSLVIITQNSVVTKGEEKVSCDVISRSFVLDY